MLRLPSRPSRATLAAIFLLGLSTTAFADCPQEPRDEKAEILALKKASGRALRDEDVLRLIAETGPIEFKSTNCDEVKADECRSYSLATVLPDQNLWIVHVGHYEGESYKIVDMKRGTITDVEGFPWFSPDKKRFVAVTNDPHSGINAFVIWRASPEGFQKEWGYDYASEFPDTDGGYCVRRWAGSARVEFETFGVYLFRQGGPTGSASASFDGRTWHYKRQKLTLKR